MHRIHTLNALSLLAGLLTFCGCSTPKHTDLLIFGTNTQFGVSAATDATANPGLHIGFKRQEVVLMPLYVNAQNSKLPPADEPVSVDVLDGAKYRGEDGGNIDTYSVLATFGAKGAADTTGKGNVAIAQYFATGLAARILATAGGALVSTSDVGAAQAAIDPETAAVLSKHVAEQASRVDAIMAKLEEGGITPEKLEKAFTNVPGAPTTGAARTTLAGDKQLLRTKLETRFKDSLEKIFKNLEAQ